MNEAAARIKINKLLEAAGWRFFPDGDEPANIVLEQGVTIERSDLDALGRDSQGSSKVVGQVGINTKPLREIRIPLPPLEVQREIVSEIEGYQKVIDCAHDLVVHIEDRIRAAIGCVWGEEEDHNAS